MKTIGVLLAVNISVPLLGLAGAFTNLDFERVRQPITVFGGTPASEAFPGWTALLGGVPQTRVLYNSVTIGSGSVDLFGKFPPNVDPGQIISGNYTAGLQNGARGVAALAQTGTIPTGSKAMLFHAGGVNGSPSKVQVSLDGSLAPLVVLGHTTTGLFTGYDSLGLDVSAWAGKEVRLEFSAPFPAGGTSLDDIRFSTVALVPEPATWALLGVGGAVLWVARRPKAT